MTVALQVKQVLATLKGSQGTIRLYAAQAEEDESRAGNTVDFYDLF